jgi:addiction module RelE/StbE family toxin
MGQVIWSPSALEDIEQIAQFIAKDSSDQAAIFVGRLIEATDRLASAPLSGRIIPEIDQHDCREIIYGAYRIMYRRVGKDVWITGVVHGARNWKPGT